MSTQIKAAPGAQAYTNQFSDTSNAAGLYTVVLPANNVNGVVVDAVTVNLQSNTSGYGGLTLIAKASAPGNAADGDALGVICINQVNGNTGGGAINPKIKVPAGKGIYLWNGLSSVGQVNKTAIYTIL